MNTTSRILEGYRVLDCSIAMAGPFAAQRLGDLGADVVKVEPVTGEWQRHAAAGGARGNRINVSFLSLNRNKRSLAVDLKADAGKQVLLRMVETADVFLQNYRPGVAERLGVDYATLSAINPRLVYVSMSGYGEDGPDVDQPGQDLLLQARSGAMLSTGRAGEPPQPAGQYLVDAVTASTAFEAVLAALLHRERTGEGQLVKVNMLDAITTLQMQELSVFTAGGVAQQRSAEPHAHVYIRAPYGTFKTSDGFLALAMPDLPTLGRVIGEPAFLEMCSEVHGWTHRDEVHRRTADRLELRTTAEWLDRAQRRGHLVRTGPRLPRARRRPADQAQRHIRRVRPPDRGAGHHARFPVRLLPHARRHRAGCAAGRRAHRRAALGSRLLRRRGRRPRGRRRRRGDAGRRAGGVMSPSYSGLTWDHPRGRDALVAPPGRAPST